MVRALLLCSTLLLTACQTTGGSFCDLSRPIRLTDEQIAQLTDAQVRDFLAFNRKGAKLCGWRQ